MTLHRSLIRARAMANVVAADIVPAGSVVRAKVWSTKPDDLPLIVVFTRTEDQESKDVSAAPTFSATVILDFEIGINGDDPSAIEDDLDGKCEALINAIMTDPVLIAMVEQVKSIKTAIDAREGEYQYFRARVSIAFAYTEMYEPVIPDLLALVDAKVDGRQPTDPAHPAIIAEMRIAPQS
jgi:hypothetical protein